MAMVIEYPTRCRILDVEGGLWHGIGMRTPPESQPHVGKEGLAEEVDGDVRITLDDGTILYGYECWWRPLDG